MSLVRKNSFKFILGLACIASLSCAPSRAEGKSANYEVAVELLQHNQPAKAMEVLNRGIIENPACGELYQLRGEIYCNEKNFDEALKNAESAVQYAKDNPSKSTAYLGKAKAEDYLHKVVDAERDYKIAIDLEPKNHLAHAIYGEFLLLQKRKSEAVQSLLKAKELAESNKLDGISRINELLELVKTIESVEVWNKAIELASAGDNEKAISVLDKGIIESPDAPKLYYLRGSLHAKQKNYDAAIKDQDKAIELSKEKRITAGAYLNKALMNVTLKQDDKAEINFKKALEFEPELDAIQQEYKKFLQGKNKHE